MSVTRAIEILENEGLKVIGRKKGKKHPKRGRYLGVSVARQTGTTMSNFEKGHLYRTKRGEFVRIYATDGGGKYPIRGAINRGHLFRLDGASWPKLKWDESGRVQANRSNYDDITGDTHYVWRAAWLDRNGKAVVATFHDPWKAVWATISTAERIYAKRRRYYVTGPEAITSDPAVKVRPISDDRKAEEDRLLAHWLEITANSR